MLCCSEELIQILFYLEGLMIHRGGPEYRSFSVRLPDNRGELA